MKASLELIRTIDFRLNYLIQLDRNDSFMLTMNSVNKLQEKEKTVDREKKKRNELDFEGTARIKSMLTIAHLFVSKTWIKFIDCRFKVLIRRRKNRIESQRETYTIKVDVRFL